MKAILVSIKPQWVEKILNGEKTIEIRKSMPKCKLPCKVYIYCTKAKSNKERIIKIVDPLNEVKSFYAFDFFRSHTNIINGKVIAEFTLNKVEEFSVGSLRSDDFEKLACLSYKEIIDYFYKPEELDGNHSKQGYAWYIDNLKIYDKPKELSEFKVYDKTYDNVGAFGWAFSDEQKYTPLKRPPQSWCYVEEVGEQI